MSDASSRDAARTCKVLARSPPPPFLPCRPTTESLHPPTSHRFFLYLIRIMGRMPNLRITPRLTPETVTALPRLRPVLETLPPKSSSL